MKKVILKLDLQDDKAKQKALKTVSTLSGIDSISMDMNEKKLTVIGSVDPVDVVSKLRKYWPADMVSVGPAEEPKKEDRRRKMKRKKGRKKEKKQRRKGKRRRKRRKREKEGRKRRKKRRKLRTRRRKRLLLRILS